MREDYEGLGEACEAAARPLVDPLTAGCPRCGSGPGRACVGRNGFWPVKTHKMRRNAVLARAKVMMAGEAAILRDKGRGPDPLKVACSRCWALRGERCVGRSGRIMPIRFHPPRMYESRRRAIEEAVRRAAKE